jgi:hypothetical protein
MITSLWRYLQAMRLYDNRYLSLLIDLDILAVGENQQQRFTQAVQLLIPLSLVFFRQLAIPAC